MKCVLKLENMGKTISLLTFETKKINYCRCFHIEMKVDTHITRGFEKVRTHRHKPL